MPTRLFQAGQSGNPGGRPKGVQTYLRERYGEDGKTLVDRLEDLSANAKNEKVRLAATAELMNRHSGKPVEHHEIGSPLPMFALPPGARVSVTNDDPPESQ